MTKATPQEVHEIAIKPLRAVYEPQKDPIEWPDDYARIEATYVEVLLDFSPAILKAGMEIFSREWTFRHWPAPGKMRAYMCEAEAAAREEQPRIYYRPPPMDAPAVPREWVRRWQEIFKSGEIKTWKADDALHYCKTGERPGAEVPDSTRADIARAQGHPAVQKAYRDSYHVRAAVEVLGDRKHVPHTEWTAAEFKAVSKRQAELRAELGIPEPVRA